MRSTFVSVACGLAACSTPKLAQSPDTRGWSEHMQDAQRHDQNAAEHEQAAVTADIASRPGLPQYNCGDTVLNDQITTGGQRVTSWQPCFDVQEEMAVHQHVLADRERSAARRDRETAVRLTRAEAAACATIPPNEREHSIFAHRHEIQEVIPHRESGQLRGVRIIFKPVAGLTADWVRQDLVCQRARWAVLGAKPQNAGSDPTLVIGADAQVFDRGGHIEVLVTTPDPEGAAIAIARAEGQPENGSTEQTARR